MNTDDPQLIIFTIGHGSGTYSDLERRLAPHRIHTIVDVRSHPTSRRAPDFRKEALEVHASASGYAYRWMGRALGGKPADPKLRTPDGDPDYVAMAQDARFRSALEELDALAADSHAVLLCAETEAARCHRSLLIAPALEERGYRVMHIDGEGTSRPHQPSLWEL